MRRPIGVPYALAWGAQRAIRDAIARPRRGYPAVHGDARPFPGGHELKLVCWNLQFCAGRSGLFFYEGGERVIATEREVTNTLADVIAALREIDADVVLLQEVDVDSDRTGRIDQLAAIVAALAMPTWTSTPYHRVPYVPIPIRRPMGRVNTHLAILSKWRIASAMRHPLSFMREGAMRRAFNLRRAVLEARIAGESGSIAVLNTHLSAFSGGDGTVARQVAEVRAIGRSIAGERVPMVLAGDFNALPPGDDYRRLGRYAWEYADPSPPLVDLYADWRPGVAAEVAIADVERYGTFVPIENDVPDRTIDHVFANDRVQMRGFEVIPGLGKVSDHLPLVFRFAV